MDQALYCEVGDLIEKLDGLEINNNNIVDDNGDIPAQVEFQRPRQPGRHAAVVGGFSGR